MRSGLEKTDRLEGAQPEPDKDVAAGVDAARWVLDLCERVGTLTDVPGSITRMFLSPAARLVQEMLRAEMLALGMTVRVDAAGNLRGMYAAGQVDAPVLLIGSHVDTVPNAGKYDGVLGVAVALACVRELRGRRLGFAIEVIAFSEEEGIRFRMPFIGSRALMGTLGAEELARRDADGISVAEAIAAFGLEVSELGAAQLSAGTFAYLEVHLEQGPVLEAAGLGLGVVTAIAGQTRFEVTLTGSANHAGTTPMELRRDALAAAAEWILAVERYARDADGVVATVGMIAVTPGAANVVPGTAVLSLDARHAEDAKREIAVNQLVLAAKRVGAGRGVTVATRETSKVAAVAMDGALTDRLAAAVSASGLAVRRMVSGAGHDAMVVAPTVPAGMLFVRTPGGVSHHPDETVAAEDVAASCVVMGRVLEGF